jgi:hypothetical protein
VDRIAGEENLSSRFLLQLHLTDEPTKYGFSADELPGALAMADGFRHARLCGFMAMAPLEGGQEAARPVFERAKALFEAARSGRTGIEILSMGMSSDLEAAVSEGATHLRVGTALFGERPGT